MLTGHKRCGKCYCEKPHSEFNKYYRSKDGLYSRCRSCANPEYAKWYVDNKESADRRRRQNRYGLTLEQIIILENDFVANGCPGCRRFGMVPHIDHCHITDVVRGVLCRGCNFAEGQVRGEPQTLRNLAAYLENPPARRLLAP